MSLERDKLKTDLAEANTRNTMLLKEGEDTTALLEKVREKEINNVEQKYQEQVRQLLQDHESEREVKDCSVILCVSLSLRTNTNN